MTLGALGTVTWTDDSGKILAFGHPFMQRGSSNFFMNKVWVLGVVPNLQSSYKVGNLGEAIGSITQDRASGIGGVVGKQLLLFRCLLRSTTAAADRPTACVCV